MKPKVYLETTIPSYLTALPSRDLVTAARQQLTRDWWDERAQDFDVYIAEIVVEEARAGDSTAVERRLRFLQELPVLDLTPEAEALAKRLVEEVPLPAAAAVDALHIAIAAASGMDYLLTWNSTHIANAELRSAIERVCELADLVPPVICTPDELLGE